MASRISQGARSSVVTGNPQARLSQLYRLVVAQGNPEARIAQVVRTTIVQAASPDAQVSQIVRTTVSGNVPDATSGARARRGGRNINLFRRMGR